MNVLCLGGLVVGYALAWELIITFLKAKYRPTDRFQRRLKKISSLECKESV
jgi:ribose 5-phosphate isomerase B